MRVENESKARVRKIRIHSITVNNYLVVLLARSLGGRQLREDYSLNSGVQLQIDVVELSGRRANSQTVNYKLL